MARFSKFVEKMKLIYIKIDLRETGWGGMDWTDLAPDREQWKVLVNMVMNLQVP
jgi:hypothetical protein